MCPAHGDTMVVNPVTQRVSCRECSRVRARVKKLTDRNRGTGRNPREGLFHVPNALLRERYEELVGRGIMTATEIALAAGYTAKRFNGRSGGIQPDIQRLKKQLGVIEQCGKRDPVTGKRPMYATESVPYDTAVLLCRAMGIEYPAEVGV